MDQRISLITLGYRDYARARDFYAALGWTDAVAPDDEVVFFQAGGMVFALWDRDKLARGHRRRGQRRVGRRHARLQRRLARGGRRGAGRRAGGRRQRAAPGRQDPWGGYSGIFVDPEGHPWEVAHNPGWTLHDDGDDQPELIVGALPSSSPLGSRSSAQLLMQ